jgi:Flp pilus assembly protein TadD
MNVTFSVASRRALARRWLLATFLLGSLAGCGSDSGKLMDSARDYIAKGDGPAAVIQLRNVLQKTPENGEARLLLGELLLRQGDVSAQRRNCAARWTLDSR